MLAALMQQHAVVVQHIRLFRADRECFAVQRLGFDEAARAMRFERERERERDREKLGGGGSRSGRSRNGGLRLHDDALQTLERAGADLSMRRTMNDGTFTG